MSYGNWKPYVPVAKRRAQAAKVVAKANKAGQNMAPVVIEGRAIAHTFWGKAWCDNLEAYSDYENRLPRGRTYVRNGSVIDLQIEPGKVKARVMGSDLYAIEISIAALADTHWKALAKECTGSFASLVELLQGRLSKAVMERICAPATGLFPAPRDIQLQCSCPDWATMCKHVAAVLYGVGARLDAQPELLFTLRQVDANDLVTQAAELPVETKKAPSKVRVLDDDELADVFGIEMAAAAAPPATTTGTRRTKPLAPTAIKPLAPANITSARKAAKAISEKAKKSATPPPSNTPATAKPPAKRKAAKPAVAETAVPLVVPPTPARRKRKSESI